MILPLPSSTSILLAACSQARDLPALAALILRTRACRLITFTRLSATLTLWVQHTLNIIPHMTRGQLRRACTLIAQFPRLFHLSFRFRAYTGFCLIETNIVLSAGTIAPSVVPPLSPPGELGGPGVAAVSQASATPVSFLAKWEDILTLERSARSSFVKNLSRAK